MARKSARDIVLAHTQAKIDLLNSYLGTYLRILALDRHTESVHIYDLFCGRGKYDDGKFGSAVEILRTVGETIDWLKNSNHNTPNFYVYFNDASKKNIEKLKALVVENNLTPPDLEKHVYYRNKKFAEILPGLYKHIQNGRKAKHFLFIDPYGYKDTQPQVLENLLRYKGVEVLLFTPVQFMKRFIEKGIPQALKNHLTQLSPLVTFASIDSVSAFVEHLRISYKKKLSPGCYVSKFELERDSRNKYALFFFTRHIKGQEAMTDAMWKVDAGEGSGFKHQDELFATPRISVLRQKMKIFLQTARTNVAVVEFILDCGFQLKHGKKVLSELEDQNLITLTEIGDKTRRAGSYYLTTKLFTKRDERLKFQMKETKWHNPA